MSNKNKSNTRWSVKRNLFLISLSSFAIAPLCSLISFSSDGWGNKSQFNNKSGEWNKKDEYDNETDDNEENNSGTNGDNEEKTGGSHKHKYYELNIPRKDEVKPYKKYFKSKEDVLDYYQKWSKYTVNKLRVNDQYNLNINRNHQGDRAETRFEFAGNTYKTIREVKEAIENKYEYKIGYSYRDPDDYIIDASNRLSPNLDSEFNTGSKDEGELQKVTLYSNYYGLAVQSKAEVKESYLNNMRSFYEFRGQKVYSRDELRSLYDIAKENCGGKNDESGTGNVLSEKDKKNFKEWCDKNADQVLEIKYFKYGGYLWPTQESVKEAIKNDIVAKYEYNGEDVIDDGLLDFDLGEEDENSIVERSGAPGLYAVYQVNAMGKLTAPSLVWTYDPKFKDIIRDKNQWETEDNETSILDEAIGFIISSAFEAFSSVEATKNAYKNNKLDEWNPYDNLKGILGDKKYKGTNKDQTTILQDTYKQYADIEAKNLIDKLKSIPDDVMLRGKKLPIFLYAMYNFVQSHQRAKDRNDHDWEDVYANYLAKSGPGTDWEKPSIEALYVNGRENPPSGEKIKAMLTLITDPDRYKELNDNSKLQVDNVEWTQYWKEKILDINSSIQDGMEKLKELAEKVGDIGKTLGKIATKIAAVAGPIGMVLEVLDKFSVARTSKHTFEYEAAKPDKNGEFSEDSNDAYNFSYVLKNWMWESDDFDPSSQIKIVTLVEPTEGTVYEVDNRIFYDENYAINYKKLAILDKLKDEAAKDISKVTFSIPTDEQNGRKGVALDEEIKNACKEKKIISNLDCAAENYFSEYIYDDANDNISNEDERDSEIDSENKAKNGITLKYKDVSGKIWDSYESAKRKNDISNKDAFFKNENLAKMTHYSFKYLDGREVATNIIKSDYKEGDYEDLNVEKIVAERKKVIIDLINDELKKIEKNRIKLFWTDLLKTREFYKLQKLDINKHSQEYKIYKYTQRIGKTVIRDFYFRKEIDAYNYILKVNDFKKISVIYPCYEYRIFNKTFYNKADYETYILNNLKECETNSLEEYEENVNT